MYEFCVIRRILSVRKVLDNKQRKSTVRPIALHQMLHNPPGKLTMTSLAIIFKH